MVLYARTATNILCWILFGEFSSAGGHASGAFTFRMSLNHFMTCYFIITINTNHTQLEISFRRLIFHIFPVRRNLFDGFWRNFIALLINTLLMSQNLIYYFFLHFLLVKTQILQLIGVFITFREIIHRFPLFFSHFTNTS